MNVLFIRTIILYALVITALRLMGKRQIGELQPSELVVAIMISDLASVPMSEVSVPLLYGIVPIFTLVASEILVSYLCLHNEKARTLLSGRPQLLMKNGRLCFTEMKKSRVNIDDLLEELRKSGYFSLSELDTVVLETCGDISVIPVSDSLPLTLGDMNKKKQQPNIPYVYVSDGRIRKSELDRGGRDYTWIERVLKKHNIDSVKSVFILSEDSEGNVFVQDK